MPATIAVGRQAGRHRQSRARARDLGIGMVFQHFSLFETLTVAENIALALDGEPRSARPARSASAKCRRNTACRSIRARLRAHDVGRRAPARRDRPLPAAGSAPAHHGRADVGADAAGGARSCSRRCAGSRRKAAASSTSATSSTRSARCATTRPCCARGRVTGTCDPRHEIVVVAGAHDDRRATCRIRSIATRTPATPRCVVRDLTLPADDPFGTSLADINLTVRAGEIVGIAGVSGNGQKELLAALSGERRCATADAIVHLRHARRAHATPRRRRALGFCVRAGGAPRPRRGAARCRSPTTRCSPRTAQAW